MGLATSLYFGFSGLLRMNRRIRLNRCVVEERTQDES